ncbi:MAG: hypothetical protein INQ03_03435 [Candidatus Heimdallarchaeota archaeon]|nr:hypothetical protein [Candidatus Heimdallarchaeota archaeon]
MNFVVNWNLEVQLAFVGLLLTILSFGIVYRRFLNFNNPFVRYLTISWGLMTVFWIFIFLSYFFLNIQLFYVSQLLVPIIAFLLVYSFNHLNNDDVFNFRISLAGAFGLLTYYTLFTTIPIENYISEEGYRSFITVGNYRIISLINSMYIALVLLFNAIRTVIKAPEDLKYYSRINLLGIGIVTFGPVFVFGLQLAVYVPALDFILSGLGLLISSLTLFKDNRLLYVLPFEAHRINVIYAENGMTLFSYNWDTSLLRDVHDDLYSAVVTSIRDFSKEVLNAGYLKEIILENGVMLVSYTYDKPFVYSLFASKRSKILVDGLSKFREAFDKKYAGTLKMNNFAADTSTYEEADELINQYFNFIPHRK